MIRNPVPRNFQLPDLALLKDTISPATQFSFSVDQKVIARFDSEGQNDQLIIRGHILNMNNVGKEILEVITGCTSDDSISGQQLQLVSPESSWDDIRMLLLTLFENGILELK
jgi:hypothetical protein